jgi:hypothetical protein
VIGGDRIARLVKSCHDEGAVPVLHPLEPAMIEHGPTRHRTRSVLTPLIGGLALIAVLVAAIALRADLGRLLSWTGDLLDTWVTEWIPAHRAQTGAIIAFAAVALVINWVAHVRGRWRAWTFALVVEIGLWILFWFGLGVPSIKDLLGLDIPDIDPVTAVVAGSLVIAITGAVFWFLELREEWRKYRHRVGD